MKRLTITILYLALFHLTYAQTTRKVINFNDNWEMYRIDSVHQPIDAVNIRNSTSFKSQFNQENIKNKSWPADSIRSHEIHDALKAFSLEYPAIKGLSWENISLPHPARYEQELNPNVNQFTGICYYRKQFIIPADYRNKHLYIRFEGAMHTASVWVNGKYVTQHAGGYLPFNIELDGNVNAGNNEIIVRLDNNDNINLPPGKPLARMGFLYWSGIYRDTWLIATNKLYITDPTNANTVAGGGVFARCENISVNSADVLIKTQLKNSTGGLTHFNIKQILKNNRTGILSTTTSNDEIANENTEEIGQTIKVTNPSLWSTDEPNLYSLTTQVWIGNQLVDDLEQKIGIRKLSYSRTQGFRLNDKPLKIVGTNRHQDFPFVGNAMSDEMQCRDMKRIKEAGFNFVRLSHYPQDPSVYKFCDSIGLMLGDPIPGWQFFNSNEIFSQRVFADIRQMIRRDRNHPSIIMWEVSLNETYPADSFRVNSSKIAHEEYPGDNFFTSGDTYAAEHTEWDVPYNSWEDPFGRPQDIQPNQAGFVREYGDYEFGGDMSTTRVNRADGEKALLQNAWNFQWEHNLLMGPKYYPWTIGDASWAFYDGFEATRKTTSNWGIVDVFRLPKFGYYFFRSQLSPDKPVFAADNKPMVYIANWWTPAQKPEKVIVYSNCDEVALYINGRFVKKQHPDHGPDIDYGDYDTGGKPFDGGNANNLPHAPFTFTDVKWQPGELKVIGYIHGKETVITKINSPVKPIGLKLVSATEGIPLVADGTDAVFVYAQVVDKNGTIICLDNKTQVHFKVSGNGKILGPGIVRVQGGIASVLVRADKGAGTVKVNATADTFREAHYDLKAIK